MSWHRRKLAVLAAVTAVLASVAAATPSPPDTVSVVRLDLSLPGGAVLAAGDLDLAEVPTDAVPDGALADPGQAVGRMLSGPGARGQVLTGLALVALRTSGAGRVVAPVRLADPDVAALVRPGDRVDVLAADPQSPEAAVVASGVRVLTVPQRDPTAAGPDGVLVLLEVDRRTASALARAAVSATLSVIWTS